MAIQTQAREVTGFDRIELSYTGELFITQGETEALTVEAEDEVLPKLESRVEGGTLHLTRGGDWKDKLLGGLMAITQKRPVYRVALRTLRGLKLSGQGKVEVGPLTTEELELGVSGLGTIHVPQLSAERLKVTSSGRSELSLGGSAREQTVVVSGSAEYQAAELASARATVRISGHGNIHLNVSDELDVTISGFGSVTYRGQPQVRQTISGGGQVRQEPG